MINKPENGTVHYPIVNPSMKKTDILYHLAIVAFFLVLAFVYCKPILNGKVLFQHDMVQSTGAAEEITEYKKSTGEYTAWTNSMFGGMPSYTIKGNYPKSYTTTFASKLSYLFPTPVNLVFFLLLGAYIMFIALGFDKWTSLLAAIGIGFSSYNIIIISAGHISKVFAVAYAAPMLAGLVLLFRGKYLLGALISLIFIVLELYSNHIQITYYLAIGIVILGVFYFYEAIRAKTFKTFISGTIISVVVSAVIILSMASRYWTTYEYTKASTRGPSELVQKSGLKDQGGLDKDYAFGWSYGIAETFTYIIPNFYGGSSSGQLTEKSNIYKELIDINIPRDAAKDFVKNIGGYGGQLYWGEQSSTSGPAYMGAIICFLFLFALLIVRNTLKWWILGIVILFSIMAMGKNVSSINYLLFDYLPLYNKFRAVTMIHSLVSIFMVWLAAMGLNAIVKGDVSKEELFKKLKISSGVTIGLLVFFWLFGSSLMDFEKIASNDPQGNVVQTADDYFKSVLLQVTQNNQQVSAQLFDAFKEDRISIFKSDVLRSLVFIALAIVALWLFITNKIEKKYLYTALTLLILVDMWGVAKRYFSEEDFKPKRTALAVLQPSAADIEILKDKDPNYRVMNTTVSTFNDATTSLFHKSIGGYSGAKLKRIQEVIERHISKNNMAVLNMLNTKYFIVTPDKNQPPKAQLNREALGNAWFVKELHKVDNANQEIDYLENIKPESNAVYDARYSEIIGKQNQFEVDSTDIISLTTYKPNELTYTSNANSNQFAVFSEMYYNTENGWKAYIDGKEVNHARVNYILRGLPVPAGKHTIVFKFEPHSYMMGETLSLIGSIMVILSICILVYLLIKRSKKTVIATA